MSSLFSTNHEAFALELIENRIFVSGSWNTNINAFKINTRLKRVTHRAALIETENVSTGENRPFYKNVYDLELECEIHR